LPQEPHVGGWEEEQVGGGDQPGVMAHSQATESGGDYAVSNSDNDRASGRQGDCAALARSPILSRYGAALMPDRRIASIENVMADCKRKMKIEDDMADSLEKEFAG
jgi:hypothetical protein